MDRRNTIQKELVLSAVMTMRRHVTADEVYNFIRGVHPSIGKGTIYRNLAILAEEHKIRRIEIPNGPDHFDYDPKKHYHVRCIHCGMLSDVDLDVIPELEAGIRNTHGILFLEHDILFKGLCPDCQKNNSRTEADQNS